MKQHRKNTKSGRPKRRHATPREAFESDCEVPENPDWLVGAD